MGLDNHQKELLDQAWMDSLLSFAVKPESAQTEETRIAGLWTRIDTDAVEPSGADSFDGGLEKDELPRQPTNRSSRAPRVRTRWIAYVLAASVVGILLALPWALSPNQAMAAIVRANQPFPSVRKYRIQISSLGDRVPSKTVWLYLDSDNRYVIEHPSWFRSQKTWIGGDSLSRWIVLPAGPAFVGSEPVLDGWLTRRDSDTPYLYLSTILERMKNGYSLNMVRPTDRIPETKDAEPISCNHIVGELRLDKPNLPSKIDLWTRRDDGMVQRVVLKWNARNQGSETMIRKQWTIDLVDTPDLPSNWFAIEGHTRPTQRVIEARNSRDLDSVESKDTNNPMDSSKE